MIDIKQAAAAAEGFVRELYPSETLGNLRIEELEPLNDGATWSVTVGWVDPTVLNGLIPIERRIYRTLQVDAATGKVTSMKMHAAA